MIKRELIDAIGVTILISVIAFIIVVSELKTIDVMFSGDENKTKEVVECINGQAYTITYSDNIKMYDMKPFVKCEVIK